MARREVRCRVSQERVKQSGQHRADDDQADEEAPAQPRKSAEKASAATDDVLDDIDRALKSACGFDDDEIVSDEELEERAHAVVMSYQQKGGQ
jgi:hypothetical protein